MSNGRNNGERLAAGRSFVGNNGDGHNGNGLTNHRLTELERRMSATEAKVDDLTNACTRIETKLNEVATKNYVLTMFGGSALALLTTIAIHMLILWLRAGSAGQ